MKRFLPIILAVLLPAAAWAQVSTPSHQQELSDWHSATQKTGLVTMYVTTALGITLAANKPTLFSDGLCKHHDAIFGEFGCDGGLSIVHFIFAGTTLGLFIATEILAAEMNPSPYETGNPTRDHASTAFLWTNVTLFALQPLMGVLAAHPGLLGIPEAHREAASRVLRTLHLGVGVGLASTYSIQAGLQW